MRVDAFDVAELIGKTIGMFKDRLITDGEHMSDEALIARITTDPDKARMLKELVGQDDFTRPDA